MRTREQFTFAPLKKEAKTEMKLPTDMTALLALVRTRLDSEGYGSRVTLGSLLGVTPVTLSNWLAEEPRRHPDGERTLALLRWLAGED